MSRYSPTTTVIEIGSSFCRKDKNQKKPSLASVSTWKYVSVGSKLAGYTIIEKILDDFIANPNNKEIFKLGLGYQITFEELFSKFLEDLAYTMYHQNKNVIVCLPSSCHSTHAAVIKKTLEDMQVNSVRVLPKPVAVYTETNLLASETKYLVVDAGKKDVRVTLVNCSKYSGDLKELRLVSSNVYTCCGMAAIDYDFEKKVRVLDQSQQQKAMISWNLMKEKYPHYTQILLGKKNFYLEDASKVWDKHLDIISNIVLDELHHHQIDNLKVFFIGGFSKFKPLQEKLKNVLPDNVQFLDDGAIYRGSLKFVEYGYKFNYDNFPEVRNVKYDKEKKEIIKTETCSTNSYTNEEKLINITTTNSVSSSSHLLTKEPVLTTNCDKGSNLIQERKVKKEDKEENIIKKVLEEMIQHNTATQRMFEEQKKLILKETEQLKQEIKGVSLKLDEEVLKRKSDTKQWEKQVKELQQEIEQKNKEVLTVKNEKKKEAEELNKKLKNSEYVVNKLESELEAERAKVRQLQTELHVVDQEKKAVLLTGDQERKIQDIKNLLLDIKDNSTTEFILDTFIANDRNMEMNYYSFILYNTFQHVLSNEDKFTTIEKCWNNFVTVCNQQYSKYLNNINEFKDKYIEIVEKAFEMKELTSKNKIPPFKLIWIENSSNFDQTKQQVLHTEYITTMTDNNETQKRGTREYITLTPIFCVGTENVVYEKAYVVLRIYQ
ncbi:hypothetical protein ABK040_016001 [Willaertia magna]